MLGILLTLQGSPVFGGPTFTDNTFNDADWTLTERCIEPSGCGVPCVCSAVGANQVVSGGNPGSYRWAMTQPGAFAGPATVWGFNIRSGFSYNPASQGAIVRLNYDDDSIMFTSPACPSGPCSANQCGQEAGPALKQGGEYYYYAPIFTWRYCSWTHVSLSNLTAANFRTTNNPNAHPDFSSSGGPIEFGYVRLNGNSGAGAYTNYGGVDNWTVGINPYLIQASAGSNGSITPAGSSYVNGGANKSYTIAAVVGYVIADVLVDGVSVGAVANYTFTNVTADHTIQASFAILCSPAGPPYSSSVYKITGVSGGAAWSWSVSAPSFSGATRLVEPGVASGGSATALASRFEDGINHYPGCGSTHLFAKTTTQGTAAFISIRVAGATKPTLCVGTSGASPNCCPTTSVACPIGGGSIEMQHATPGNGGIIQIATSGIDCNSNGEDDTIDIIFGTSADVDGNGIPDECAISAVEGSPREFRVYPNLPNPFTRSTRIDYDVPATGRVAIHVYDLLGRRVRTLLDRVEPAGRFAVEWDGKDESDRDVAAGVYLYTMESGTHRSSGRMILSR